MGVRRKGREFALQILYLSDISQVDPDKAFRMVTKVENIDPKVTEFTKKLVTGTLSYRDELDKLIVKYTENWELSRMAALDRNILRLGTYEIVYELDTPVSVIIDEAVEIAKTYSTPDSGKFVNGILDKVKLERNGKSETSEKSASSS